MAWCVRTRLLAPDDREHHHGNPRKAPEVLTEIKTDTSFVLEMGTNPDDETSDDFSRRHRAGTELRAASSA
jgi:hypothetical protein